MIKIYNSKEYFHMFRSEELIIEDDGLIYRGDEYYKTFRNAAGKVDFNSGYIYGEKYYALGSQPIGKFCRDGNVIKVYGDDYYRTFAQPIYYIRGNALYSADQFYKTFPIETAYVEGTIAGLDSGFVPDLETSSPPDFDDDYTGSGESSKKSKNPVINAVLTLLDRGFWGIVGIIVILALIFAALYFPFHIMAGNEGSDMARVLIIGLVVGGVASFATAKDWEDMYKKMLLFSILGAFAVDVYQTYQAGRFTVGKLIVTILLGAFVYGLVLIVPCLLLTTILWFIKSPFVKRKQKKNEGKEEQQ